MPFSSKLITALKVIGFAAAICFSYLWLVRPEGNEPKPVMTPSLKLFYQKTSQIHPGITEVQVRRLLGPPDSMTVYPLFNSGHTYEVWQWNAPDDPSGGYLADFDETGHTVPPGMYPN